ncbi:MAG: RidA family protein [Deltaproteobacteria bacterium]|nr:RidA family protein [Deltaproteobacteria bacterium]NND27466.1 RidA family protein [Myxococcales bacterium]MBT8465454.1 RidA family protein [Deltaproteobacteria bacterium]MBT8482033.1 RidA family protein [Deltaproteobacteria bacterium]NNK07556.1 RidA family protein [Myxococcales bacterium]
MTNKRIETDQAPAAIGPYCQAVAVGDWVYCSGQLGLDPKNGEMRGNGDIELETKQVLQNLAAVLEQAGANRGDVVKATVYLTDMNEFSKMNEVYAQFFEGHTPPARATVQVAALPKGAKVEIDFTARLER